MISEMLANPIASKFQCLGHYFSLTVLETSPRHLQMEFQVGFFNLGSTMFHSKVNSPTIAHPRWQSMQQPMMYKVTQDLNPPDSAL